MNMNECTEIELLNSFGELFEKNDQGLDFVEQERSWARASQAELQREFIGVPNKSMAQREREILREKGIPLGRNRW